ncbi:ATP-binding protein [Paenibacillus sp. FJAT-27812]|uniref:ATP-binding protein n=1 Tax=Paenibacillus sp. FJAT-27812 TaxID=1684143 RepID=UPI0006A7CBE3|nr:ATP-binding protein [Paenibacillus sp. FJAT-27812]
MVNQLLIHLIIILFPIFIQQFFLNRKKIMNSMRYQVVSGLMFGTSAILCMAAPVHMVGEFQGDLRTIPIIISILYSGGKYVPGILAITIAALYRVYLGGDAVVFAGIIALFTICPCFFLVKPFLHYKAFKRIVICLLLALNSVIFIKIFFYVYIDMHQGSLTHQTPNFFTLSLLVLASLIGMGISALLKEHIIETNMLKLELERSEKLKIVSQIAASVAHEVRNPLTVVKGFLQLLKESVDDKQKGYMNIALSELDRAVYIITDYLNLAKPQADQLELIEVSSFLTHTIEIMNSYSLIQNVQMHLNCSQTDLFVWADKPKLSQVILNLIKNGVEAIPDTGEVIINAYNRNEEIFIEIMDTGTGMSKEDLDNIGSAFFTTKETGTGLGILVTIRIVEALNGKITFESKPGEGTKITIRFPAAVPEQKVMLSM